jgi:hypothetical protein
VHQLPQAPCSSYNRLVALLLAPPALPLPQHCGTVAQMLLLLLLNTQHVLYCFFWYKTWKVHVACLALLSH